MADRDITRLLREAAFSFVGTVEHAGASTLADVDADERTVVVHVDEVLHAPEAFVTLAGSLVTLQPAADSEPPEEGTSWLFFANGLAFGRSIALTEIGRLSPDALGGGPDSMAAGPGGLPLFEQLQADAEAEIVREHAKDADAIVVARVIGLERAAGAPIREHDPDWWRATMHVRHAERGDIEPDSELKVLYANSLDVRWRDAPKPKAAQNALWLMHATEGALRELAPFQILHPLDVQPVQNLEFLREENGP